MSSTSSSIGGGLDHQNGKTGLLTQDFNTIVTSSNENENVSSQNNTVHSAMSTFTSCPASLPFTLLNDNPMLQSSPTQAPPPAFPFIYPQQFAIYNAGYPIMDPQLQQQYFMMAQRPPNKRVRINENCTGESIVEQLDSFKNSLKSSFDRNLQKLEVLDRLVQTVTVKGSVQIDSLKASLQCLQVSKGLLKSLIAEQVDRSAALTNDLKATLLPELKSFLCVNDLLLIERSTKGELLHQLRKEENSHLTDLSILSTRNKELQMDQNILKSRHEKLQLEFSDALKSFSRERDEFNSFHRSLNTILYDENTELMSPLLQLQEIERFHEESESCSMSITMFKEASKAALIGLLELIHGIKNDLKFELNDQSILTTMQEAVLEIIEEISLNFENITRLYRGESEKITISLTKRIDKLLESQNRLAHEALNVRMNLQGQLSDSLSNCERLRRHCQELTAALNLASEEVDKYRIQNQIKESELNESRGRVESLKTKCKTLENELSMKNQEFRAQNIKIQELQSEAEEVENRHRHDVSVLERKISILESKQQRSNVVSMIDLDPLSRRDSSFDTNEVSTIPATVASNIKTNNVLITFTGIREAQQQRDLNEWLKDLGGRVHVGADFHDDITHVLAPVGYKSIRVLAASLTGKWIVPVEWVLASRSAGHFVCESLHGGFLNTSIRPFRLRTLWMSVAFSSVNKAHPIYPTVALRTLLEKLGRARWCEMASQADFLLVTPEEKDSKLIASTRGVLLTLDNLINMIPISG